MATVTTLGFSIRSSFDPTGTRGATRALLTVGATAEATSRRFGTANSAMGSLITTAAAVAPALAPIATVAAGVGASTVAMAVSSGSALGIYGAAMAGAIKRTNEMAAAGKALDPTQKAFVTNVNSMKGAWDKFIASTSPVTLRAATTVVQGITAGIQRLKPVVDAVAPSIQRVADAFKNWMQGAGLQQFINDIIVRGVPALNSLLNAGRNVLAVLGIGFRTFAGEGVKLAAALERGSVALRQWAEGGGFSRFLATVNQHAPQVRAFFDALWAALRNVSTAMMGLGPLSLGLATALLRIVAAMPPALIQAIVVAFVAWRAAMLGMMIITTIVTVVNALRTAMIALRSAWFLLSIAFSSTPLGLIITLVAGLVAGIVYLATQTRFFQTVWNAVWNGIRVAFAAVTAALSTAWRATVNGLVTAWNTVGNALRVAWSAVWNALRIAGQAVWNAIRTAWNAVINGIRTITTTAMNAVRVAWTTAWNAVRTAGIAVWNALRTAWQAVVNAIRAVWNAFSSFFRAAWNTLWNGVRSVAQSIWNAIRSLWQGFITAVRTIFNVFWSWMRNAWEMLWNGIRNFANTVWNAIRSLWQGFVNAVRNIFNVFWSWMRNAWEMLWNGIKNFANTVWNAIKKLWQGFVDGVKSIWNTFKGWFEKAWSNTWNAVKDIANKIWHEIGEIIEKAINAVISIVNGLIKGFNKITSFLKIDVQVGEIGKVNFNFAHGGMVPVTPYATGGIAGMEQYAKGGVLRGYSPGRDTVPAMLSPGEGILTPEAVRGLGGAGFVHSANKTFAGHRGAGRGAAPLSRFTGNHDSVNQRGLGRRGFSTGGMVQHFALGGITAAALQRAGGGFSITQGEYSTGVAASAGTHDRGGAIDIAAGPGNGPAMVARLRAAGFAAWLRTPAQGFSYHIHAVLMNHPDLSPGAAAQVQDYLMGGDGLGVAGGGGGGGIDILGMVRDHVGAILHNVYNGLGPLADIGGAIATFFGMGSDEDKGGLFGTGIGPDFGPDVAGTVGDVVGSVTGIGGQMMEMLGQVVLSILDADNIAEGLGDADKEFKNMGGIGGGMGQIALGFGRKILDSVMPDFLIGKKDESTFNPADFAGGFGTGNVQQWSGMAAMALARAGINSNQLGAFLALMQAESGGNPMAMNNWDSNAAIGQASRGLMQVIPGTFAMYRDHSLPNNIFDPMANMVAAANYIKARYGGNVPGSPYFGGTNNASRGWHLVGENGPEMRFFRGGEGVMNARATTRALNRVDHGGGVVIEKGAFQIDARGATTEAVREMESNLVPKLRLAVQAGVGKKG